MAIFGYSGLSSSPTSQQTSWGSIQPWAQPYISNYLNQGQQLAQNAQPTALQQQAYSGAANLQTPGQFSTGANLAQQGGQGMLGTTGTALGYGAAGAGYGNVAAGAGQNYAQMATNPSSIQAYMNPYIQQSLAPQMELLNQQQALAGQGIAAKAVGQGAFGGNRAALAQGLSSQNYDLAKQQAIAQGYNQAFQQAQQAQQFGANLGLQGLQAAMQGQQLGLQGVNAAQAGYQGATQAGAALGNLGAQQSAAQLGILGLQNQLGTQQYNMPFQNLQFQQGLLSGLPISTQTQQGFTAPPSTGSQLIGMGTTALGGYLAGKAVGAWKTGGKVKSYADGGDIQSVGMGDMGIGKFEQDQIDTLNRGGANPLVDGVYASNLPSRPNTLQPVGAGLAGLMQTPQQDNVSYLNSLYSDYLGRKADEAGFQHNLDLLNSGSINRQGLANAFMQSAEAQSMPRLMGSGLSGAGRNEMNAAMNPLMQLRPTDQENYTGFVANGRGSLTQMRPTDQENYTGFAPTGGGSLMKLRPTDQENYTGVGPTRSSLSDIRLNQLLG